MHELLRGEISAAIKRLQLLTRNVELYRDAVRARVFAEEGRRLAEEANLLKSRFLATVSHELRTPLSLIVGAADMILHEHPAAGTADPVLPQQIRKDVESIQASAEHLARLISDVLDLASSQAGELKIVGERLLLTDLLGDAAILGERMVREKGLAWRARLPAVLPVVEGDRTRLQQVILNLISNAVKFTEQGTVTLWAEVGQGRGGDRGERHRHGHPERRAGGDLRRIPALGAHRPARVWRHGPRTRHQPAAGRAARRQDRRHFVGRGRCRIDLLLHPPMLEWPEEADARPDSRLGAVLLLTERPDGAAPWHATSWAGLSGRDAGRAGR